MPIPPVLESIFGALSDGVCVSDGGRVSYLNPAAQRMLGVRPGEPGTRPICDLLCGQLSVAGSRECASSCPLRDPADPSLGVTFRGLHERPPAFEWRDEDIRRAAASRALRVRCLRLPGTDCGDGAGLRLTLIEDAAAEVELERRKEDWRSMVVHDLRAPMTNLFGALRTIQDESAGSESGGQDAEALKIAVRNCRRVMAMLDVYLDLAKLEADRMSVMPVSLELANVARRAVAEQSYFAAERGLRVDMEIPTGLRVRADAALLPRVLQNLLNNALKFSPDNGRVLLSAAFVEPARAALSLRNDGPPISPEELPHVFRRYGGGGAPVRAGQGSGLGLSFCREALRAMGGEISVASQAETGTVFTVLLPRG